jgi:hypothetical protein
MPFERRSVSAVIAATATLIAAAAVAGPEHDHPAPEKLGTVYFPISCAGEVASDFERGVALLHSFAYGPAARAFAQVSARDPACAMAHWGIAMSTWHELWSPPTAAELRRGREEIQTARRLGARTDRERLLIGAAAAYFSDDDATQSTIHAQHYEQAMETAARNLPQDTEVQVFYALSLLAIAPPTDRTHADQKRAAAILEPIYRAQPDHPGVAHYLIHACDSSELAARGLPAARAYALIAPSAPHALHMPSHIFTRLGLWDDSIGSNEAARAAAHSQGDVGEELHAMDYLTYAYLQRGRDQDAERVVHGLADMGPMAARDFKVGYAATAMPVRLAMERQRWNDAVGMTPLADAAPQVAAVVYWARAVALSRSGHPGDADAPIESLAACQARARAAGADYWVGQIEVLSKEARAWQAAAAGKPALGVELLRSAADAEDATEKLPVTPGPIIPAREQLGELLLQLGQPRDALRELTQSLKETPARRGALQAAARAADGVGEAEVAARFRAALQG